MIAKLALPRNAKSLIWLLKLNKLKSKYNTLAKYKAESLLLAPAPLAIY